MAASPLPARGREQRATKVRAAADISSAIRRTSIKGTVGTWRRRQLWHRGICRQQHQHAGAQRGSPPDAPPASLHKACPTATSTLSRIFPGSGSGTQQFNSQGSGATPRPAPANRADLDTTRITTRYSIMELPSPPAALAASRIRLAAPRASALCAGETAAYTSAYSTGVTSCTPTASGSCSTTFAQCGTLASSFGGSTLTVSHATFDYANNAGLQ